MKQFRVFTDHNEAQMAEGVLQSNGLKTSLIGNKEYVALVAGGGAGRYELLLEPQDFAKAEEILSAIEKAPSASVSGEPNYFKRAVMQSILGVIILPVVFNIAALMSARKFWDQSKKDAGATMKLVFIALLQIPTLAVIWFFIRSFL